MLLNQRGYQIPQRRFCHVDAIVAFRKVRGWRRS